jgi:hypothetical protein
MKMQWIPTAERLPTVDDLKVKRPCWRDFDDYIEGMVVVTIKAKRSSLRKVDFAWCVIMPPHGDGTPVDPWFETTEGKVINDHYSGTGWTVTAWSPVDVPGPYQEGGE